MHLDQFFTNKDVAAQCLALFRDAVAATSGFGLDNWPWIWVDPSAGRGAFLHQFPDTIWRIGFDIDPKIDDPEITQADFLETELLTHKKEQTVVIGNPPFGKSGKTAIQFINHAANYVDWVAFIVPVSFRKYRVHRRIEKTLKLVLQKELPPLAFYVIDPQTGREKTRRVNTLFQVWTRHGDTDLRKTQPEPIAHEDFDMYQYNNTKDALKYFDKDFDFAVPCQGWQDYSRREMDPDACEKHKQWMLFKCHSPAVRTALTFANFEKLAIKSTSITPGFRKADVVEEYVKHWKPHRDEVGTSSGGWS